MSNLLDVEVLFQMFSIIFLLLFGGRLFGGRLWGGRLWGGRLLGGRLWRGWSGVWVAVTTTTMMDEGERGQQIAET